MDYMAPIALFDQPLVFSLAATGASIGVHAEGIGQWDDARPALTLDPSLYVGGDLTLRMVFNAVPFTVQIGAAARIDISAPAGLIAGPQFGIYLGVAQGGWAGGIGGVRIEGVRIGGVPPIPVRGSR
jgi:hypothetical protein